MRLHILSDLHFEFEPGWLAPRIEADLLVLAGDIEPGTAGLARFVDWGMPVIYVPGNHEYYGGEIDQVGVELRRCARELGVHLLDNDEVVVGGVRFLGTTLWTDFRLDGSAHVARALVAARRWVVDFRAIRQGVAAFTPEDTLRLHEKAVSWLEAKLAEPFDGATVVVTHHAPHRRSVHGRFSKSPINPAFASDLTHLLGKPVLWVHGHMHDSFDYVVEGTRVVCNPKGYVKENAAFASDLMVTV